MKKTTYRDIKRSHRGRLAKGMNRYRRNQNRHTMEDKTWLASRKNLERSYRRLRAELVVLDHKIKRNLRLYFEKIEDCENEKVQS